MDMLKKYGETAKRYEDYLMTLDGAVGVMHLGGIARSRADEHSDIDIAVFSHKPIKGLKTGEQLSEEGYDVEIFNIVMSKGFGDWSEIQKEAYDEGFIARDTDGQVKSFITKALEYKDEYRLPRVAQLIFNLAWHGWIYTPFRNRMVKGYNWIIPRDIWFGRGDPNNAFYLAQVCLQDFIELLFAINKKWTPDYKWRYIKSKKLAFLPENYIKKTEELLFTEWTEENWEHKAAVFQSLLDETVAAVEPDLPDDWYALIEH